MHEHKYIMCVPCSVTDVLQDRGSTVNLIDFFENVRVLLDNIEYIRLLGKA